MPKIRRNPEMFGALYGQPLERQKNPALRTYDPETESKIEDLMKLPPMDPEDPEGPRLPPNYRPEPFVIGDQDFAKTTHKFLQRYPEVRGRVDEIRHGLGEHTMRRLQGSGMPIDYQGRTTLQGSFHPRPLWNQMLISPGLDQDEVYDTMIHEGKHALGDWDDSAGGNPYKISGFIDKYRGQMGHQDVIDASGEIDEARLIKLIEQLQQRGVKFSPDEMATMPPSLKAQWNKRKR